MAVVDTAGYENINIKFLSYKEQREWADKFNDKIRGIVGKLLIQEASHFLDTKKATDFVIPLTNVGARVRRYSYYMNDQWRHEFTIRTGLPVNECSRVRATEKPYCELEKLLLEKDGPDVLFYGFVNQIEDDFFAWFVGKVRVFLDYYIVSMWKRGRNMKHCDILGWGVEYNNDGSPPFIAVDWLTLPEEFFLGMSPNFREMREQAKQKAQSEAIAEEASDSTKNRIRPDDSDISPENEDFSDPMGECPF